MKEDISTKTDSSLSPGTILELVTDNFRESVMERCLRTPASPSPRAPSTVTPTATGSWLGGLGEATSSRVLRVRRGLDCRPLPLLLGDRDGVLGRVARWLLANEDLKDRNCVSQQVTRTHLVLQSTG